jgi:hypothetical protein
MSREVRFNLRWSVLDKPVQHLNENFLDRAVFFETNDKLQKRAILA